MRGSRAWPRAYRPLRPAGLLAQVVVLVVAEVGLYASYAAHDARFHWATHFLVGLLLTALWQSLHLLVAARPARAQVATVLVFHLWAMWPDLLFRAGVPHYRWMDWVAVGHISSHYLPGGDTSWLVLALAGVAGYVLLLARWVGARRAEASAGLAPGLGIGGRAVLRPQADPRARPLGHVHLTPTTTGGPTSATEPLLLLHGLGGTSASWLPAGRLLAGAGHHVLVPDLLGFGSSLGLGTRFRLPDQVDALLRLLDHHDVDTVHLVGHSWGCVVAGAVAVRAPDRVSRLTLVAPAVFAHPERARERIAEHSALARMTFASQDIGGLVCGTMCLSRPVLARVLPSLVGDVPADVVRGGVQHSYPAYRDALTSMWDANPLPDLLRRPRHPTAVVLAEGDTTVSREDVLDLGLDARVDVTQLQGTHGVVYEQPEAVAQLVAG